MPVIFRVQLAILGACLVRLVSSCFLIFCASLISRATCDVGRMFGALVFLFRLCGFCVLHVFLKFPNFVCYLSCVLNVFLRRCTCLCVCVAWCMRVLAFVSVCVSGCARACICFSLHAFGVCAI